MNTEGYEIESLKRVATGTPYTWKKAEFTSFRTTDIDYIFTNMVNEGDYKETESDHMVLYVDIKMENIPITKKISIPHFNAGRSKFQTF